MFIIITTDYKTWQRNNPDDIKNTVEVIFREDKDVLNDNNL